MSTGSPLLSGASGRLWVSDGRVRLELQSDAGDAQILFADGHLSVYDASTNTVYRADSRPRPGRLDAQPDHGAPSVADIDSALSQLAQQATLSGAQPTTQAGQPAYKVSITPKHDAGLLGQAEIAWDAANGIPLHVAVTAAGSSSPVLALEVTDISYGAVDTGALAVPPPAGAKVVDLGSLGQARAPTGTGARRRKASRPSGGGAVHARRTRPLVGLPRTGVRLVTDGKDPVALVTYGQGLGAIAVLERSAAKAGEQKIPLAGLPAVSIDGATGHELPTALGTLISVERGGVQLHAGRLAAAERGRGRTASGARMSAVVEARGLSRPTATSSR